VDHRAELLDKTVSALADSRAQREEALKAVQAQREQLKLALEQRTALENGEATVENWLMADNWLKTQGALEQMAVRRATKADAGVEQARVKVLSARADLRRIEALATRLQREEQAQAERAERKLHDELAAQRFARRIDQSQKED
jgi:flagellar export protein FliJ